MVGCVFAVLALDGPTDAPRYRCTMPVLRLDDVLKDVVKREALESGIRLVGVDGPSGEFGTSLNGWKTVTWAPPVIRTLPHRPPLVRPARSCRPREA